MFLSAATRYNNEQEIIRVKKTSGTEEPGSWEGQEGEQAEIRHKMIQIQTVIMPHKMYQFKDYIYISYSQ